MKEKYWWWYTGELWMSSNKNIEKKEQKNILFWRRKKNCVKYLLMCYDRIKEIANGSIWIE